MNRVGWWGAAAAFATVEVAYLLILIWLGGPAPEEGLRSYIVTMAIIVAPAALAAALLWRAWWPRTGTRLSAMDAPARLLATAVATLPADRRGWGTAMTAELTQVADRRARWRFAAGCARTAVFPPRGHRVPALAVAAVAAGGVVVTGVAVGHALPEMRVFAVTFVALVGGLATLVVARSRRVPRPAPGLLIAVAGLAGVAACTGLTGYYLATDASVVLDPSPAITLAVVLAGGLWLTLVRPRALTTSRYARWAGLGSGLVLAAGLFWVARVTNGEGVVMLYLLGVPVVALFLVSTLVAVADGSFWAGLQAAVWAVVFTCLLSFAIYVAEAFRFHRANGEYMLAGDDGPIGATIHEAIGWVFILMPVWMMPFGVIGAALGAIGSNHRGAVTLQPTPVGPHPA